MKLSSMAILLLAVGALMIPVMPSAMAMPDANLSCDNVVVDGITDCRIGVAGAEGKLPLRVSVGSSEIRLYNDEEGNVVTDKICPMPVPPAGKTAWRLEVASGGDAGKPIGFVVPKSGCDAFPSACGLTFKYPHDPSETTTVVTRTGSATLNAIGGATSGATSIVGKWVAVAGPLTNPEDALSAPGRATLGTCGQETGALDFDEDWEFANDFIIQKPIGGTLVPINMVSLLVTGFSTSAMWLASTMIAAAGIGIVVYTLKKSKQ